ncbi:hypothetical protein G3I60_33690 [Streptomyces sp. SID13666]|nr:hypothetical protein [Streptomyces sp. SID13666]
MASDRNSGQYAAREADDQLRATQLISIGGPEVRAAARIALEGPAPLLQQFIASGQFMAERKDNLATTHASQVQALIAGADSVAAIAQQNAAEALRVAAVAINAATDAENYRKQALQSAAQAATFTEQARKSAQAAEASAARAAASAKTARTAETTAKNAARDATNSATHAADSAAAARGSADAAWSAANEARASAVQAGKDAAAADQAAIDAWKSTFTKLIAEAAERRRKETEKADRQQLQTLEDELQNALDEDEPGWWDRKLNDFQFSTDLIGMLPA